MMRSTILAGVFGFVRSQDLFLAHPQTEVVATTTTPPKACIKDNQCSDGNADDCCSGKLYFTSHSISCYVHGEGPCSSCKKAVQTIETKLQGGLTCDEINAEGTTECTAIVTPLLVPVCELAVQKGCAYALQYISQGLSGDALQKKICEDTLHTCGE